MNICREDDLPEEYYFFLGLMAIGAALGNEVVLKDREPVRGNLMLCLVGPSGLGKSRSIRAMSNLLSSAFPFHVSSGGVKSIANVGSAESLVDEFHEEEYDPATNSFIRTVPVRGVLRMDELTTLVSKSNRQGSTLKPMIMELYDSPAEIVTRSRTHGKASAKDHFFQMVSTTQPDAMSSLLSDTDSVSGFLNRWVFINGTPKVLSSYGGVPLDVEDAVVPLKDIRIWGTARHMQLILEPDALRRWDQFFQQVLVPYKMDSESPMFARSDLLMKKLMLLLSADRMKAYVSIEMVEAAIQIWEYLSQTYLFVQDEASVKAEVKEANQVESDVLRVCKFHFDQTGRNATMRDIQRRLGHKWKKHGRQKVLKAITSLCVTGELMEYPMKNASGRTIVRYQVRP